HLAVLERAAAEGDLLVVGLNGDASVARLKGRSRPILNLANRSRLLAALEVVDFVTSFDEDTPAEIVRALQPDVLVKGGDWSLETIGGRDVVEARGGRVVRVPWLEGLSTSSIIARIRGEGGGEAP